MNEDPNQLLELTIDCPKCKFSQNVKLLSVTNNENYSCTQCGYDFDLGGLDPEANERKLRNSKEFDKLKKLLDGQS